MLLPVLLLLFIRSTLKVPEWTWWLKKLAKDLQTYLYCIVHEFENWENWWELDHGRNSHANFCKTHWNNICKSMFFSVLVSLKTIWKQLYCSMNNEILIKMEIIETIFSGLSTNQQQSNNTNPLLMKPTT